MELALQRHIEVFQTQHSNGLVGWAGRITIIYLPNRRWKTKMMDPQTEIIHISVCRWDRITISKVNTTFSKPSISEIYNKPKYILYQITSRSYNAFIYTIYLLDFSNARIEPFYSSFI